MHICHVITRLIVGGAQENTILTCEGLHQRGHRIVEVPVSHFPRRSGKPSGAAPRVVARAFVELWRLGRCLRRPVPPEGG